MIAQGAVQPSGRLGLVVIRGGRETPVESSSWRSADRLLPIIEQGLPQRGLHPEVNEWRLRNARNLWRGFRRVQLARTLRLPTYYGALFLTKIKGDGEVLELGLASLRVVTTAGVGYIVDAFQNLVEPENMKFHAFGVGTNAEAAGDTALQTEETTQYNPDNTRPTGTTTEGASANIYRTVGTYSPDSGTSPRPITEHGILSQAATGGGVLLDRTVFSVVNLVTSADSLQATYELTFPSGS